MHASFWNPNWAVILSRGFWWHPHFLTGVVVDFSPIYSVLILMSLQVRVEPSEILCCWVVVLGERAGLLGAQKLAIAQKLTRYLSYIDTFYNAVRFSEC